MEKYINLTCVIQGATCRAYEWVETCRGARADLVYHDKYEEAVNQKRLEAVEKLKKGENAGDVIEWFSRMASHVATAAYCEDTEKPHVHFEPGQVDWKTVSFLLLGAFELDGRFRGDGLAFYVPVDCETVKKEARA